MKRMLAIVLGVLLVVPGVAWAGFADMLNVGADQWDAKYSKPGTLAGRYGERQIDTDGLDCTPLEVKLAVVGAYAALVAGIVVPAYLPGGRHGGGYTQISKGSRTRVHVGDDEEFRIITNPAQFVKSGGSDATNLGFLALPGFLGGMATALYLSDSIAHARCMAGKGYQVGSFQVAQETIGARGCALKDYGPSGGCLKR